MIKTPIVYRKSLENETLSDDSAWPIRKLPSSFHMHSEK